MGSLRVFFLFLGSLLFAVILSIIYFLSLQTPLPRGIHSPIPDFLKSLSSSTTQEFWKPKTEKMYSTGLTKPKVSASAAISYDLTTDKLLFEKNIKQRFPIASLTKIMTAILALESMTPDQIIMVTNRAATIGEDSMGIADGEKFTLQELLYGLFLHSGNDAAEAIAESSPFGRDNFVYLMNKKAEDMGLSDTHFTNPTGLEGDGNQYSTVIDLLAMTRYGLQNPFFAKTAATVEQELPPTQNHKAYSLFNETNLLTSYPGVKGIKTGFTNEAGMCLVTFLEYKGHSIIAIVLHSDNRRQEMKDILDYSLKTLGINPPPHS